MSICQFWLWLKSVAASWDCAAMPLYENCVLFGVHLLHRKWYTSNATVCGNCVRYAISFKIVLSKTIDCSTSTTCESQFVQHLYTLDNILSDCIDDIDYFQSSSACFECEKLYLSISFSTRSHPLTSSAAPRG